MSLTPYSCTQGAWILFTLVTIIVLLIKVAKLEEKAKKAEKRLAGHKASLAILTMATQIPIRDSLIRLSYPSETVSIAYALQRLMEHSGIKLLRVKEHSHIKVIDKEQE